MFLLSKFGLLLPGGWYGSLLNIRSADDEWQNMQEQISLLKAYYSIADNIEEWNNVMPPLKRIDNPSNNKQVIALLDLVGQIDTLVTSSS